MGWGFGEGYLVVGNYIQPCLCHDELVEVLAVLELGVAVE